MNDSFDVAVVGLGPTGAVCTALLGSLGLKTIAIEREPAVYDKPRAFALDHEVMRVFEDLGIAAAVAPHTAPFTPSEYYGVDGQLIKRLGALPPPWPLGWPPSMVFNQPAVDAVLRDRAAALAEVAFSELENLVQKKDLVELQLGDRKLTAKYVVGCDGAASTVRQALGIEYEDLEFDQAWLVVDLFVNEKGLKKLPQVSVQYCEPARPSTYLVGVGSHRRWELMLDPGEEPDAWELLARWITPDDAQLWRAASYRFHALVAREWRRGRVFLAGDAAHQQPPFTGQGMCQGIRDAANLSWKLHHVLAGKAKERLLDTYEVERRAHAKRLISTREGHRRRHLRAQPGKGARPRPLPPRRGRRPGRHRAAPAPDPAARARLSFLAAAPRQRHAVSEGRRHGPENRARRRERRRGRRVVQAEPEHRRHRASRSLCIWCGAGPGLA